MKKNLFPLALSCSLLLVAAVFSPYLSNLVKAWNTEEYSHGYLIPVISFLIGWHMLTEKKPDLNKSSWAGVWVILSGFFLLLIAQLSAFEIPAFYGFLLCLTGVFMTFFGVPFIKATLPGFIYLIFCIPLPRLIQVALSAKLQLISSTLGVFLLQLFGVPVFQDGNIIDLGYEKIQVVEACSGLRYLFPLMSLSFLVAFLLNDKMWKRILIFLSAIPITVFMNSARIAWVGFLVNWRGPSMAEGTLHDLQGWVVFAVCLVVLLIETWVLMNIGKVKGVLRFEYLGFASGALGNGVPSIKKSAIVAAILCTTFSILQFSGIIQNREQIIPQRASYASFPQSIAQWQGKRSFIDNSILDELVLSDYVSMEYKRTNEAGVNLYVAYYEKQGVGASIHSPANCIPGGGWKITGRKIVPVDLGDKTIPVSRMLIEKDGAKLLVYYWLPQRGRIINDQYGAKFYLLVDSIIKNRSDGALVRITSPITDTDSIQNTDDRIKGFIKDAYSTIERYIPD